MKKLLYVALVSLSVNAFAQDETTEEVLTTTEESSSSSPNTSKNGHQLTPEAGDIGLGMDATPFLQYLGNAMNGENFNAAPNVQGINNAITVKYFLSDDMAARVRVGINQTVQTDKAFIIQDKQTDPNVMVSDRRDIEVSGYNLAAGVEMRRGNGRVQGYYGGEVFFARSQTDIIYQYGNEMRIDNQNPLTSFLGNTGFNGAGNFERQLYSYDGTRTTFGLNGFIGVEYFVAPRVSLGGQFDLSFFYTSETDGLDGFESWGDDGREIIEDKTQDNSQKFRGIQSLPSGAIVANFYF